MKKFNEYINEKLKINSKSKINYDNTYAFDLNDYKETIELPFLLYTIDNKEHIKICKIDDALKNGKHHIRLFDENDNVVTELKESNAINLFKRQRAIIGNLYSKTETFKYRKAKL